MHSSLLLGVAFGPPRFPSAPTQVSAGLCRCTSVVTAGRSYGANTLPRRRASPPRAFSIFAVQNGTSASPAQRDARSVALPEEGI